MGLIRFVVYWAVWGAAIGCVGAIAITVVIVFVTAPPLFAFDNYFVAGVIGAMVGVGVGALGGLVEALRRWRRDFED